MFTLRSSSETSISLHNGTGFAYKIVFGADDNQKIIVQDADGSRVAEVPVPHIMAEDLTRFFWLNHNGTQIELGLGQLSGEPLLQLSVEPMKLKAIQLDSTAMAEWNLPRGQ